MATSPNGVVGSPRISPRISGDGAALRTIENTA